MQLLVLTAFIAAFGTSQLSLTAGNHMWQVGKLYHYDVKSHTLAYQEEGPRTGSAFRARFIIRVVAPGYLQAKLENPEHTLIHHEFQNNNELPKDLTYQPVPNLDQHFEFLVVEGRVKSLNLPSTLPLSRENLLKGLLSALQVDFSTYRYIRSSHNSYDKDTDQGLFKKMETDVTGDCETLYSVSPVASEWRREIPHFASADEPIEITKSKNYHHCHHRVDYHFGVPEGAEWTGTAHKSHEEQFISRSTVSRILMGKQGPMYKSETTSIVHVHPHLYGKQKARVHSQVTLKLVSYEQDNEEVWPKIESGRFIENLLYSISSKQITISDSSSSSSSESKEMNSQVENAQNRMRRSLSKSFHIDKMIVNQNNEASSSSSSMSSSSSEQDSFINDDIPKINEPAYAALYMTPQNRVDKKQSIMNAQKLVQDIAQQLQHPNNMPKADALSKFGILVHILASMSLEQLTQTSKNFEIAISSNNNIKSDMWMVYRDAVAQTGTLPAFQQIKVWIQTKKLQEEEAAQVIASLAGTLRYPTKDLMLQFFDFAMSDEVRQQKHLNDTALIVATRFINRGHVNNDTAHNFYPTHMYGRFCSRHDPFVVEKVLPRLSQEFKNAVEQEDSRKAQVYLKAIGNLGHRSVLEVFAPYLEGKIPVSTYLRREIIEHLDVLSYQKCHYTREVLYKILRNTAEPYEVRVAAIHNIMISNPTTSMMMAMAKMTHDDPSIHVRASLKTAIESASKLKNIRYLDLARTAKAAMGMVTKEEFGHQYSKKKLDDYYDKEYEMGILKDLSTIGSHGSLAPNYVKYSIKSKSKGWNSNNQISASFSNVDQFIDYFKYLFSQMYRKQEMSQDPNHKYSAEKISEMLNIKYNDFKSMEAAFYLEILNQQRLFTFSESDIKQLPKFISQYFSNLNKGIEQHYTKIFNQQQVAVMFPVAMGVPFIFKYKEPTVVHIQGKLKGQHKEGKVFVKKEIHLTYARNLDGSVGFLDTISNQYPCTGVVNKLQVNVPLKLHLGMNLQEVQLSLEPLHPDQDYNLLHYSVWPYTANQKKDSLIPVSQDTTTKVIDREFKTSSIDTKFGQSVGMQFQFQGYSYSSDYKNMKSMCNCRNLFVNFVSVLSQKDVALTHYNLKYLAKQSQNKRVTFTAVHDTFYNQKQNTKQEYTVSDVEDVKPNSESRRKEMLNRVVPDINTAKVIVVDLSVTFEGTQQIEYVFTSATAKSPIDHKIHFTFFAGRNSPQHGNHQVNGIGMLIKPEMSFLNFFKAFDKEIKAVFAFDVKYGQNGSINVKGFSERSKKYEELLKNHPLAKVCKDQMSLNNYYQEACHKMIVLAHAPDFMKASVTYKEISPRVRGLLSQAYKMLEYLVYLRSETNPMKVTPDGKVEIAAQISYFQRSMDLVINSRMGELHIKDLPMPEASANALALYTPFKSNQRVNNYYTSHQYLPYCTVDESKIKTFSNRAYDYKLSKSWHVVMLNMPSEPESHKDKLVVLSRRPTEKQQEIYISYRPKTSSLHLEVEIQPPKDGLNKYTVKVNTNSKKISEGDLTIYWDDVKEIPLLQYYTYSDGVLVLDIKEERLRLMYDGQRLVLLSKKDRKTNRGICGRMTGAPRFDYLTPFGLVDLPEHYGAAFSLDDENADPKTKELLEQAKKVAYQVKYQYTTILNSSVEWMNTMQLSSSSSSSSSSEDKSSTHNVYRSRNYSKQREECQLKEQVQYYENHGEICISIKPIQSCQQHCNPKQYTVQSVEVICRPKIDQQYKMYRDEIRRGGNPKVSGLSKLVQYRVPSACTAY
ncbi:vitellogenin-like [Galleria mellonella]|uniref:Vitellogenin-like n=1 Tax=Galleria mellonella TaxID=7137 RepID=A0ABM3MNZ6_GALME|nr:vitellogenin-like [Galleria mellonella]